ncbi:MAG: hypothetical protein KAQ83_03850 [Nanoarchaeota archaeon]|nr:hypothetical protein [Nanoarchaeota archaeon]
MKLITKLIFIFLTLLAIYGGLYVYSLSQITVPDVQLNRLEDVSLTGFVISGGIIVANNGLVPVKIDKIKYNITLDFNQNKLSDGYISGTWIKPNEQKEYDFSNKINWVPTVSLAWDMIKPGSTTATIRGFVYVADFKYLEFKVPFQHQIDLEEYIEQFATNLLETAVNKVKETVESVGETIGDLAKGAWNGIKGIFS